MIAKFCDLCGQPLVSGSKFCSNCGQAVRTEEIEATPPQIIHSHSDAVLAQVYLRGEITLDDALSKCSNQAELKRLINATPSTPPKLTQEAIARIYASGEITLDDVAKAAEFKRSMMEQTARPVGESILTIKYKGFFLDTSVVNFGIALDEKVEVSGKDFAKSFEHRLTCAPGQHMLRVIHFLVEQKLTYPLPIWKTSKELIVAHQWEIPLTVGHNHVELKVDRDWGGMLLTLNGSGATKGYKVTVPGTTPLTLSYWDERN